MIDTEQFYPTPKGVIFKMVKPYLHERFYTLPADVIMLEPSAGNGDILDFLKEKEEGLYPNFRAKFGRRVYCIEQNPNRAFVLQGKGYKLLASDFLTYEPTHKFNLILMNPPFANGADHLLKAWEILHCGDICCLLNAETLENAFSEKRKLLKSIIDEHGTTENLGTCFDNAERKTGVNVVMVRLKKAKPTESLDFEFSATESEPKAEFADEEAGNGLMLKPSLIETMARQYDKTLESFQEFAKAISKLRFFSDGLTGNRFDVLKGALETLNSYSQFDDETARKSIQIADFQDELRRAAWVQIISKCGIEKYLTSGLKAKFELFVAQSGSLAINHENVNRVLGDILYNANSIMDQAVLDVFDIFTKYHEENRCHVEGWKTNDSWKVNRKIVLPNFVRYDSQMFTPFSLHYHSNDKYSDIDKVMCYLSGSDFAKTLGIKDALGKAFHAYSSKTGGLMTCESEYFEIKFFKKGTVHLKFKSERLWNELNLRVAKSRNWLPN